MSSTFDDKLACLQSIFGRPTLMGNKRNAEFWCPACNSRDRSRRKLSIRIDDGAYHCWVCNLNGMHPIFIVHRFFGRERVDLLLKHYPRENPGRLSTIVDERPRPRLMDDFALLALSETSRDLDVRACLRYVRQRGLTLDDCWRYRLGSSRKLGWSRRVIVPSFDRDGELNYYTGRAVDPAARLRYNTVEADRSSVIFNEIDVDWSKQLVLCEGPFDALKCGDNAVPLLGNSLNEDSALFCAVVMNATPIALALDADMRRRTLQLVEKLEQYKIDVSVVDLGGRKDPGEMSKEEFAEARAYASRISWGDSLKERVISASVVRMRV